MGDNLEHGRPHPHGDAAHEVPEWWADTPVPDAALAPGSSSRRQLLRRAGLLGAGAVAMGAFGGMGTAAAAGPGEGSDSNAPGVPAGPSTQVFGPVTVRPGDQRYQELVTGDNQRWVAHPDYIQIVGSTQQVIDAVGVAVRAGTRLSVRSGGHCYEDFVSNPEVRVIIDMSGMNAVYYDPKTMAFAIEPGATLLDAYETLRLIHVVR